MRHQRGNVVIKARALVRINKLIADSILIRDHIADDIVRTLPNVLQGREQASNPGPPRTFIFGA
jgi:hypothetical protein